MRPIFIAGLRWFIILVSFSFVQMSVATACDRSESLTKQWTHLDADGQNEQALGVAQTLRTCIEAAPQVHEGNRVSALWRLGASRGYLKQFDASYALFKDAIKLGENALGPHHDEVILALYSYGDVAVYKRDYTHAANQLREALKRQRHAHPKGQPMEGKIRVKLARLASLIGAAPLGVNHLKHAIGIYKAHGADRVDALAKALAEMGRLLNKMGQLNEARRHLDAALTAHETTKSITYAQVRTLYASGSNFERQGRPQEAIAHYQRALKLCQSHWPKNQKRLGVALNNLALAELKSGAHGDAERHYLKALKLFESAYGADHLMVGMVAHSMGEVYMHKGNLPRAVESLQRALKIRRTHLGTDHPKVAIVLGDLALMHTHMGDFDQAEKYATQALEQKKKHLGETHPDIATSLDGLALLWEKRGDLEKALSLYEQALKIDQTHFPASHPRLALRLNNLGTAYENLGRYDEASHYLNQAYAALEKANPGSYKAAIALRHLSVLDWRSNRIDRAIEKATQVAEREETYLNQHVRLGSFSARDTFLRRFNLGTSLAVSMALAAPTSRAALALGVNAILRRKARSTEENQRLNSALHSPDPKTVDRLKSLRRAHGALSRAHHGLETITREDRKSLEGRIDKLADGLSQEMTGSKKLNADIKGIQARLGEKDLLLDWIIYEPYSIAHPPTSAWRPARYAVLCLSAQGPPQLIDVGDGDTIHALIDQMRRALTSKDPAQKAVAQAMYKTLFQPIEDKLAKADRLLLSPDGLLNLIPFGALVDRPGRPLVTTFKIQRIATAREILAPRKANPSHGALVFANPDFQGTLDGVKAPVSKPPDRLGSFGVLPGTAAEADQLSAILGLTPKQIYLSEKATEAELRAIKSPQILHIATHGFSTKSDSESTDPRLDTGLVLAGVNQRGRRPADDDGVVTALEIGTLDLHGTELVVLSACETTLGQIEPGEGLNGLQRALTVAGAKTVIASLWKVDDDATAALMSQYYRYLRAGTDRVDAFRQVQLDMQSGKLTAQSQHAHAQRGLSVAGASKPKSQAGDWTHPYYWASFTLSGADGPIRIQVKE